MRTMQYVLGALLAGSGCDRPLLRESQADSSQAVVRGPVWTLDSITTDTVVVIAFIGASWCGASKMPALPSAVREAVDAVRESGIRAGLRVHRLGVWMDPAPASGAMELASFGDFEEIVSGGSWLNLGAVKYLWGDVGGPPSVPQVLITLRPVLRRLAGLEFGREELLVRLVGFDEIVRWAHSPRVQKALETRARLRPLARSGIASQETRSD